MTDKELIELAAKAVGIEIQYEQYEHVGVADGYFIQPTGVAWNPLTDQADSDRMACKLKIAQVLDETRSGHWVTCRAPYFGTEDVYVKHNNTDEDVCRAVREARLAVAVEIGKGMK